MNQNTPSKSKPPVIAHVIHRLQMGGLENGLVNLINRLPQNQFKHVIICLTESTDFAKRIQPKVEVIELHKKEGKDIGLYWRLYKTFRALTPDIVHTRNLSALESQLPAFLAGVEHRIHGLHGWDVHDMSGDNMTYQKLHKYIGYFVNQFVVLSDDLENYLANKVGVSSKKIVKICNGVDTDKFFPADKGAEFPKARSGVREIELPWKDANLFLIGTVGRLEIVKDQTNLVKAFILLLKNYPEFKIKARLVLVGEGTLRPDIEMLVNEAELSDYVWLAGARDDVAACLRSFDLFVLPSKAEGISNTILEAMASGLPVIATAVGGNAQLVDDGNTGQLVPPEDPEALTNTMRAYLHAPDRTLSHAANARRRALQWFSMDKMVSDYQNLYEKS